MALYKADYYDSNNIFMVPLVWYMYVQNCIAIDDLQYNMHILPKFQIDENCFGGTCHVNGSLALLPPMHLPRLQPQLQVSRLGLKAFVA